LAFSDRIGITQPTTILLDIETDHNQHQPAGLYQLKSCRKLLLVGVASQSSLLRDIDLVVPEF
jgi:hypothetical protein